MVKEILIKISDSGSHRSLNDIAKYSFNIQSKLDKDPKNAYNMILPIVNQVNRILKQANLKDNVKNVKIDYSINKQWNYETNKLVGYTAVANVYYDFKLEEGSPVSSLASQLQDQLVALSVSDASVLLNNIDYTLSETEKKVTELTAIKKAIRHAKKKAEFVVKEGYDSSNYVITKMDISTNGHYPRPMYEARSMKVEASDQQSVISQGTSEITATANLEINVIL